MRLGLTNENGRDHQDEKSHYSALCKTALNNFVTGFQATLNLKYTIEEYTVVNALLLAISKKITLLESL